MDLPDISETIRRDFLNPRLRKPNYLERKLLVDSMRTLSRDLHPRRILDVGCGLKPYESILRENGATYLGFDNPVTLESAGHTATRADLFGDNLNLPFAAASFDTVVCTQVIEHSPEPGRLVGEIARVLEPGGHLLLSGPMTWPLHEEPYDFFRFTHHGLRHLLTSAGLEVVTLASRGGGFATLGQLFLDLYAVPPKRGVVLWKVFINLASLVVNPLSLVLDRLLPKPQLTLGWTVVARKSLRV